MAWPEDLIYKIYYNPLACFLHVIVFDVSIFDELKKKTDLTTDICDYK